MDNAILTAFSWNLNLKFAYIAVYSIVRVSETLKVILILIVVLTNTSTTSLTCTNVSLPISSSTHEYDTTVLSL